VWICRWLYRICNMFSDPCDIAMHWTPSIPHCRNYHCSCSRRVTVPGICLYILWSGYSLRDEALVIFVLSTHNLVFAAGLRVRPVFETY
jgi:hypothetical protein